LEYKYRSHYPSMIFFEERVGNKRLYKYYWWQYKKLLKDVDNILWRRESKILEELLLLVNNLITYEDKTLIGLSHWDLHDLNYCFYSTNTVSYNVLFLDEGTIGKNTFIADFVCYYWFLIYKSDVDHIYNKKFRWNNPPIEVDIRNIQIDLYLQIYFYPIVRFFYQQYNRRDEFIWKLILRILWVYNILDFKIKDRIRIYKILTKLFKWYKNNSKILPFHSVINYI
jgi:acetyltransferase-like isoleucine patch superfamily enzyme